MCVCALSRFSHVLLFDSMDYSLPGSSIHGILQARILKWVALPFSKKRVRLCNFEQLEARIIDLENTFKFEVL